MAAAVCAAVGAHRVAAGVGAEPAGVAYASSARRAPGVTAWEAHVRTRMVNLQAPVSAL